MIINFFIICLILIFVVIVLLAVFGWYSYGYIIENGRRTEAIITSVQSRSQTDRYGRVHVSYIVSYQFQDLKEQTWRGKFTIRSSTCKFKEEDRVIVYYLPNKPYKNTVKNTILR